MKINIFNHQKAILINIKNVKNIVKIILNDFSINCNEVNIYFVDEKEIKKLHKDFFNDNTPTDCISFPIDPIGVNCDILGEIFVCTEVAINYAKKNNIDKCDETLLYLIHGLLHLIGYNDKFEHDIKIMREKEQYCLDLLKKRNLSLCNKK